MTKLTEGRSTLDSLIAQIVELRREHLADPDSSVGVEAWNLLAELMVQDGDIILDALTGHRPDAVFLAALSGICANPNFFGPVMQQEPAAAVEFAHQVAGRSALRLHQDGGED